MTERQLDLPDFPAARWPKKKYPLRNNWPRQVDNPKSPVHRTLCPAILAAKIFGQTQLAMDQEHIACAHDDTKSEAASHPLSNQVSGLLPGIVATLTRRNAPRRQVSTRTGPP